MCSLSLQSEACRQVSGHDNIHPPTHTNMTSALWEPLDYIAQFVICSSASLSSSNISTAANLHHLNSQIQLTAAICYSYA